MRKQGLRQKKKRPFAPKTADRRHGRPVTLDLLLRRPAPSQVLVNDINYIPTQASWFYLAAKMDLFSRCVVGWDGRKNKEPGLVIGASENAAAASNSRLRGLFHLSDQGSHYASNDFSSSWE